MVGRPCWLPDHYEVGREKIREFARAVRDTHRAHHYEADAAALGYPAVIAPVTFTTVLGAIAQKRIFDEFLPGYDLSQMLHTEQRIRAHRPVHAGDRLRCRIGLHSFRQIHGQDVLVFETAVTDADGYLVQTIWTTAVARSRGRVDENIARAVADVMLSRTATAGLDEPLAFLDADNDDSHRVRDPAPHTPRPQRRFADVAAGQVLAPRTVRLTRGDLVNYAGVSGDPNPIHWSDRIAALAGLDTVIAHGGLTMGLGAGYLTSWIGDPGAVREYRARFSSPVYVDTHAPAQVEFTARIKSLDTADRTATVAIVAVSGGRKIFGRADTVVQLA